MSELDVSDLARQLAAQRRTVAGQCAICQAPIVGLALRRYCSNRCRQAAKHARAKAARALAKERARIWFDEVDTRATALVLPPPELNGAES